MPDDRIKEWIRDRRREQNKIAKRRSRQRQKAKRLNTLEDSGVTLLDTSSTSLASSQTALTRQLGCCNRIHETQHAQMAYSEFIGCSIAATNPRLCRPQQVTAFVCVL